MTSQTCFRGQEGNVGTEFLYAATTIIVNGKFVLQLINMTEDDFLNFLAINWTLLDLDPAMSFILLTS